MNSARRAVEKTLAQVDVVIELMDARLPGASANPLITQLRDYRQRPCLKVLNKADLADEHITAQWLAHYREQTGVLAVALNLKTPSQARRIPALCQRLAPYRNTGDKPLRMLILGIPNVGKSTLMNALVGRKVAKTGDEPAVTKSQQRFDLSPTQVLFDTPGLMWPKIEHPWDGFMLAACHAIGANAVTEEAVAHALVCALLETWPKRLWARYGIDERMAGPSGVDFLPLLAKKRGCLQKGGVLDLEKAARVFLLDFRSGALGRLSLETPASRQLRLASVPSPVPVQADE